MSDSVVYSDRQLKKKEHFSNSSKTKRFIYIHLALAVFAIYLSFKCNPEFNIGSLAISFFFPYIYIIYILATKGLNFCIELCGKDA